MPFNRLIMHYSYDPEEFLGLLSDQAVEDCWFELHRRGGCGAGELRLQKGFLAESGIEIGHWIALEARLGERWYLGRVEQIDRHSPAGVTLQLEGPGIQLNEVYPGAFSTRADGQKPHRYGNTDLFSFDPDRSLESVDSVANSAEVINKLLTQYITPQTDVLYDPALVETGPLAEDVISIKLNGEETTRSIIKDLAMRAGNAAWGVDAARKFYFLQTRTEVATTYQENLNLTRLSESRSRNLLYNRITLTGGYVYDQIDRSSQIARRSYRWRGNYRQPESIENHGERRIRMSLPWIRTITDARAFAREFFHIYADPAPQFQLETSPQTSLPIPWLQAVCLQDRDGNLLTELQPERIRVHFDHAPQFRIELGPQDPHELWPEPPQDERWELPDGNSGYGEIDITDDPPPTDSSFVVPSFPESGSSNSSQQTSNSSLLSSGSDQSQPSSDSLDSSLSTLDSSLQSSLGYSSSVASSSSQQSNASSSLISSNSGSSSQSPSSANSGYSSQQTSHSSGHSSAASSSFASDPGSADSTISYISSALYYSYDSDDSLSPSLDSTISY